MCRSRTAKEGHRELGLRLFRAAICGLYAAERKLPQVLWLTSQVSRKWLNQSNKIIGPAQEAGFTRVDSGKVEGVVASHGEVPTAERLTPHADLLALILHAHHLLGERSPKPQHKITERMYGACI